MIRIALWKLSYELYNLRRALQPGETRVWYFGFGANLDPACLKRRKIKTFEEEIYCLQDHALVFDHPGPYEGMGFASVSPQAGAQVWGKRYLILKSDFDRLCFSEMVPYFHRYQIVQAQVEGIPFFYFQTRVPQKNLRPTPEYKAMILAGLRTSDRIPESYIKAIEAVPTLQEKKRAKNSCYFFKNLKKLPLSFQKPASLYEQACMTVLEESWKLNLTSRWIDLDSQSSLPPKNSSPHLKDQVVPSGPSFKMTPRWSKSSRI